MVTTLFHEFDFVIITHRNDNLLPREALCGHIEFWFGLTIIFLNIFNFLSPEIQEGLFDLENFSSGGSRCLSIQFSLSFVVRSQFGWFEIFGDFVHLLGGLGWDRKG